MKRVKTVASSASGSVSAGRLTGHRHAQRQALLPFANVPAQLPPLREGCHRSRRDPALVALTPGEELVPEAVGVELSVGR